MGWLYHDNMSKADLVENIRKDYAPGVCKTEALKSTLVGNCLWMLLKNDSGTFIVLYLLQGGSKEYPGYGYKDMDESMGPYFYSCPLSYLREAPVANQSWRDGVLKHHASKKAHTANFKALELNKVYPIRSGWKAAGTPITGIRLSTLKPCEGYAMNGENTLGFIRVPTKILKSIQWEVKA